MDSILQQITDWLKEMLVEAIMGNLSGLFDSVNNQVVVSQNKVPVSCTKTANYYISSIMMSLCTCL